MKKTWCILAIIAAATIVAYFALPIRFFYDGVFPLENKKMVLPYDDLTDGGSSRISFDLQDSSLSFDCTLGGSEKGGWCGLVFDMRQKNEDSLQNRDWTFVDSVIFELESHGTSEILVKLWAMEPGVTDTSVAKSFRLLMKELPLTNGRQRISIPMEQFYTPDFWYTDNRIDSVIVDRHQDAIVRMEIAPGWNQPRGQQFSLTFYSIQAKGLSNKTFGGVLFVMLILTIVAVGRKHSFEESQKKEKADKDA